MGRKASERTEAVRNGTARKRKKERPYRVSTDLGEMQWSQLAEIAAEVTKRDGVACSLSDALRLAVAYTWRHGKTHSWTAFP